MQLRICVLIGLIVGVGACVEDEREKPEEPDQLARITQVFETDGVLHDIRDIGVGPTGEIWVLSGFEPFVYRYTADGKLLHRFGAKGKGPGEIRNPWKIVLTGDPDAPVEVWDVGNRKLVTYSAAGDHIAEKRVELPPMPVRGDLRQLSYGEATKLRRLGSGYVLQNEPGGLMHPIDFVTTHLVRLDPSGAVSDTIIDFRTRFADQVRSVGSASTFVPVPLWTTCPDGRLVVLDPFQPGLLSFAPGTRNATTEPVDLPPVPITDDDVRRHLDHALRLELGGVEPAPGELDRAVERAFRSQRRDFGKTAPPAVDLLCDSNSEVWLEQFGTDTDPIGYGRDWTRITPGGNSTLVRFPAGFRPRAIAGERAIGILTDSLDVQSIAVARIR
jgi:hypothetical protein